MAYGDYFRPRSARMGDLMAPMAGATGVIDPASATTPTADGSKPYTGEPLPDHVYDRWARGIGGPTPDVPDPAKPATPTTGTGTDTGSGTPGQPRRTYQGGALAYYGTGNIAGATNIQRGTAGTMTGFNEQGWGSGERGTDSIKNVNGRIFSRYAAKPSSIDLVLADPDFQALFPNAKKVGFDKIDYGDGRPVDVLKAADPTSDTAEAWAWMPESDQVPTGAGTQAQADLDNGSITFTATPSSRIRYADQTGVAEPYTGPSFRDWIRRERGLSGGGL